MGDPVEKNEVGLYMYTYYYVSFFLTISKGSPIVQTPPLRSRKNSLTVQNNVTPALFDPHPALRGQKPLDIGQFFRL